jgi:hypothetical protein
MSHVEFTTIPWGETMFKSGLHGSPQVCRHSNVDVSEDRHVNVAVLSDTNFWKNLDMCSRIFETVLKTLHVSDGMKG